MKPEEAIKQLEWVKKKICNIYYSPETFEAITFAIKAIKQMINCPVFSDNEVKQPCIESPCVIKDCTTCKYGLEHFRFEKCVKCMAKQEHFTEWEAKNE